MHPALSLFSSNKTYLTAAFLMAATCLQAQNVGINNTGSAANASAMLDVSATNKGMLIPRMRSSAINNIINPAKGLMVLDTVKNQLMLNIGTPQQANWQSISFNSSWSLNGNAGTDTTVNAIGTTDPTDLVFIRNNARAGLIGESNIFFGIESLTNMRFGLDNTVFGSYALRLNSTGDQNTAVGSGALNYNETGSNNTAIGAGSLDVATGSNNTAVGQAALFYTKGDLNTAIGYRAGASALGGNNVFIGAEAGYDEVGSNKLYIANAMGNSTAALIYGEFDEKKLRLNAKVGIGRTPASFPMEIQTISGGNGLVGYFNNNGLAQWHIRLESNGGLGFTESGVADQRLVLNPGGEVGIGKMPGSSLFESRLIVKQNGSQNGFGIEAASTSNHWDFYVDGGNNLSLYLNSFSKGFFSNVDGTYASLSDRRLKKDVVPFSPSLSSIMQLQSYQYHYLDNEADARLSTGFMAQDVQQLFPEAVVEAPTKDGDTRLGINYQYFTVLAIKGLQEQQSTIQDQQALISTMQQRIQRLETAVEQLLQKK